MAKHEDTQTLPVVRFKNVSMRYGQGSDVLTDVTFSLDPGAFYFLTGPSGAGKSSLIKLMYLGHRNYRGIIEIFGQDIAKVTIGEYHKFRQQIGVVFQDFQLLDHLSAVENVALPLRVQGINTRKSRARAQEILEWVGLKDVLHASPATLSGGEKQRVALARAVIRKPALLLADEPTGSVDDKMAVRLLYLFEELHKMGTTLVLATHNRDLAGEFPHPELHLANHRLSLRKNIIQQTQQKVKAC